MPISINCRCGYNISAPERLAGRTLRCPKCLGEFTVPQASVAPPVMPMPAPSPMAALAAAPTDDLALEAAPPPIGFEPQPMLPPEDTMPLMEEPLSMPQEPDLAAPEFGESDLAAYAQETFASAPEDDVLALSDEDVAPPLEGDAAVMNEEELGMFLMDEEPPPPKKKKK